MPSPSQAVRRILRRTRNSESPWILGSFVNARKFYRLLGRTFPFLHLGWNAHLRELRWDGDKLVVSGWAYTRGTGYSTPPQIEVTLTRRLTRTKIVAVVAPQDNADANALARLAEHDYSNTGFSAVFDLDAMTKGTAGRRQTWTSKIRVIGEGRRYWGRFRTINRYSSPGSMGARELAPGVLTVPRWHENFGLVVDQQPMKVIANAANIDGRQFTTTVNSLRSLRLEGLGQSAVGLGSAGAVLPAAVPVVDEIRGALLAPTWSLWAGRSQVYARPGLTARSSDVDGSRVVRAAPDGHVEVIDVPAFVVIESAEVEREPELGVRFSGTSDADWSVTTLEFVSALHQLPVRIESTGEGRFEAFVPLTASLWNGPALPIPRGGYALMATAPAGQARTFVTQNFVERGLLRYDLPEFRLRFELNRTDQWRLTALKARRPDELGSFQQQRLSREYAARDYMVQDAVYFESFFGKNATCNPRAIDREIARRFPDMPRYWAIAESSIDVPAGAIAVITGSKEWWDARGSSRYIVTNEWLRARFVKRPFQTVLQTWHGSMFKKIGLDRTGMSARHLRIVRDERANWDYFISQNAPGTEVVARAYDFDLEHILEIGYPRNDELFDVSQLRIDQVRQRLGIAPDKKVIMYAPTWRDGQAGAVDFLNLEALSAALGDDYLILLRGHIRTLTKSHNGAGVLDVSTYPQVSELYLVADVMITDYSSMMFDYSVTGKPMIFFAPDIDEYRDTKVRGVYFNLAEVAPGPVVRTQAEVEALLLDMDSLGTANADRYVEWRKMFNHHDDGKAAQRAVDFLFETNRRGQ